MHYRSLRTSSRHLNKEELEQLEDILASFDQMVDRIETLESILDHDHPEWREKHNTPHTQRPEKNTHGYRRTSHAQHQSSRHV
ncbi:hypothetical protein GCM10007877_33460 [Marinibactrum halimedae]|uniref:Uncharacterized protein n=2 Tax=Marinibactrum halimedae TaxID=1444977 RepID=A0AA37TEL7_9GAMM|nr:hypothetical protein GCM10007877_33460 [Marinibactrum halimedae]